MAIRTHIAKKRYFQNLSKTLLLVAVPSLIAFGILLGQSQSGKTGEKTKIEPVVVGEFNTVDVFVPVDPVPRGIRLKDVKFSKIKYPRHQLPDGSILELDKYLSAFSLVELPAGLPIQEQNTTFTNLASNPVAERIPEGMRAMTVKVDPASLVNGWAGPGSLVDIALLTPKKGMVLAEKVRVLSTERFVAPVDGAPAEGLPTTATILVNQEQALAISTGMPHGKLMFFLRNARDEGVWDRREFEASKLDRSPSAKSTFKGFITVKNGGASYALGENGWVSVANPPAGSLLPSLPEEPQDNQ
jgi:Flp pilus assembly protein CpaB